MRVAADRVPELIRALHTALGDQTRQEIAEAIAAVGTREAYDQLAREVVRGGQIGHECMWVLRDHAPTSTPYIIPVMLENPDCAGLVGALPDEIDDDCLDALVSVCRRTTDPWVVGKAVDICARTRPEDIQRLTQVVEARRSELLHAGMITGLIAADPDAHLDRIRSLFAKDIEIQKLALSVPGALDLPEAQDCLRKMLREGKVADRRFALRVIEENRVSNMAPTVVDLYLSERSPRVKRLAWRAILANHEAATDSVMGMVDAVVQALGDGVIGLPKELSGDEQAIGERVDALLGTLHRAQDIWLLANVDGVTCVATAKRMAFALHHAASTLALLVKADQIRSQEGLLSTIEESVRCALGMCRQVWRAGVAEARHLVYSFSGLPVLGQLDSSAPDPAQETLPVDAKALSGAMRRWAEARTRRLLASQGLVPPDGIEVDYPTFATAEVSAQAQILAVAFRRRHGRDAEKAALTELGSSLDREQRAKAVALDFLAPDILEGLQEQLNQEPLFNLSIEQRALADHFVVQRAHAGQWNTEAAGAWGPVMREQALQVLLLRVMGTCVTARSTQLLLRCVGSDDELVSELAEALLVEIGARAIPRICNDVASVRRDDHRARLVEICRCIDAARAARLARQFIEREDPLLQVACVQALRTGGAAEDCALLRQLWGPGDELVQVSILQALATLDADGHVDVFEEAAALPRPGTWWASIMGLMRCQRSTRKEAIARLTTGGMPLQRYAAEMAANPHLFAGWTRGVAVWPAPAAGNLNMGLRIVVFGPRPFEWGIPRLLAAVDGSGLPPAELLDGDEEFAREWIDYAWTDEYGKHLIARLLETANSPDSAVSGNACVTLYELLAENLMSYYLAFAEYHGIGPLTMCDRAWEAFREVIVSWAPSDVHDLVAPNPSATNPMGDQGPPSMRRSSETIAGLLVRRFAEALPEILGIPRPAGLDAQDALQKAEAIASEWRKLMEYQDFLYGFWVQPGLSVDDLVWFACHKGADEQIKREMIDYLVLSFSVRPAIRQDRERALEAIHAIFRPLQTNAAKRIARRRHPQDFGERREAWTDAKAAVEAEFFAALAEYDVFWPQQPAAFLPLGKLGGISGSARARHLANRSMGSPTRFEPFNDYVQKRLDEFDRMDKASQASDAAEHVVEADLEVEKVSESFAVWNEGEVGLVAHSGDRAISLVDALRIPSGRIETIYIDGEPTECVDILTLAEVLKVTPEAIRKREKRGQLRLVMSNNRRYCPLPYLIEVIWLFTTDGGWAETLGVHRHTVARWRKEMPGGLSVGEKLRYLYERRGQMNAREP